MRNILAAAVLETAAAGTKYYSEIPGSPFNGKGGQYQAPCLPAQLLSSPCPPTCIASACVIVAPLSSAGKQLLGLACAESMGKLRQSFTNIY